MRSLSAVPGDVSREGAVSVCSGAAALKGKAALKAAIREVGGNIGVGAWKECTLPLLNSGQNSSESPEGPDSFVFTITSFTSHLPSFYTFLNCMLDTAFLPTDWRASSFTVFLSICTSSNKGPSVSIATGMLMVLA